MPPRDPSSCFLTVRQDWIDLGEEDGIVACPECQEALHLHQPDIEDPDRLLGVCPECRSWAVVEVSTDGLRALISRLPPFLAQRPSASARKRPDIGRIVIRPTSNDEQDRSGIRAD